MVQIEFVTVDNMPAVKETRQYSDGTVCQRLYQGGELIDATWLNRPGFMKTPVIEHREVQLYNHHYLNK